LLCGVLTAAGTTACNHTKAHPSDPSAFDHSLPPVEVADAEFATTAYRLLEDGTPSAQRSAVLAGTVQRQLSHAAASFRKGDLARGADAVVGAMAIVRAGEMRPDMFDADGMVALRGAFQRFSALGDEGRALALLDMQRELLPPSSPQRNELEEHEQALARWRADTRPSSKMERLAAKQHIAVADALLRPSERSLRAAETAINAWVAEAVKINLEYQRTRRAPRRTIIVEAYKALQLGSETMAAVFLRHGRARDAVVALDKGAAGRVADGQFFARLQSAGEADSGEDWRLLATAFKKRGLDDDEVQMDPGLFAAASWGIALEAFRRDPTSYRVAHVLASHLSSHGMPEVAPLVLGRALGADPTTVALSGAMRVVERSLRTAAEGQDAPAARRIFAASRRVLNLADRPRHRRRVAPTSSSLRHLMATIELQSGNARRGRALLAEAQKSAPTLNGYVKIATLERQAGRSKAALTNLRRAIKLPGARSQPLLLAKAHLMASSILRSEKDEDAAERELKRAIAIATEARSTGPVGRHVRAELLLLEALHRSGREQDAAAAAKRAADHTDGDPALLGEVLMAALSHAMLHRDVGAARAALQLGFKAHVSKRDMIRGALWLMLLELEQGEPSDGKVERVLADAADGDDWWNVAARWARGLASDALLREASQTHVDRVRADFYIAMRARLRKGSAAKAEARLREVASDPVFWEPEVDLARDFLDSRSSESPAETAAGS
jgi:hypothetical protein